jgi:outer membrane protein|tara:strand:- start:1600 stop:2280 length:681 start_codon:yes stop_codon:yes gene_type:complete
MADFVGIFAGGGMWNGDFTGDVVSDVDVEDELGISSDSANYLYVALEHPVPLLPNIRVARTSLQDSGSGVVSVDFLFEGSPFTASQNVAADLDLTFTDLTLYYEIWDTGFDFDIGLTARKFSGQMQIEQVKESVDEVLPMVYVAGRVGLPFSGVFLGADANVISYSGSKLADYSVKIGWETSSFIFPEFGIEAGYRKFSLNVDEDDAGVDVDVGVGGAFINLVAHF